MTQQGNPGGPPEYQHVQYAGYQAKDAMSAAEMNAAIQIQGNPALDMVTFGSYGQSVEAQAKADAQASAVQNATATDARLTHGLTTQSGPDVAGVNYQSYSHPQLHDMVTNNVDPAALYQTGDAWTQAGNGYADSANAINGLVSAGESGWQGAAGTAARSALTQTANWFGAAGQGAQATGNHMYLQSEAVSTAKNSMPPPTGFNQRDAVMALLTGGPGAFNQNIAQQAQASENARQQAIHTVQTYDSALGHTSGAMPAFAPPPKFAPAAPAPAPTSGPGGHLPTGGRTTRPSTMASGHSTYAPGGGAGGFTPPPGSPQQTGTSNYTGGGLAASGGPVWPGGQPVGSGPDGGVAPVVDVGGGMPVGAGLGQLGGDQLRSGNGFGAGGAGSAGGASGAGGAGGSRSGAGLPGGAGGNAGEQGGGARPGPGARTGAGALAAEESAMGRGVAGRPGGAGAPGMAGMGRGAKKDEDKEHKAAAYLRENNADDVFTDGMPRTAPPTIGQ